MSNHNNVHVCIQPAACWECFKLISVAAKFRATSFLERLKYRKESRGFLTLYCVIIHFHLLFIGFSTVLFYIHVDYFSGRSHEEGE